jgi:hypothetical protein
MKPNSLENLKLVEKKVDEPNGEQKQVFPISMTLGLLKQSLRSKI